MFSSVVIPNLRRFFAIAICCRNAFPLLQFKIKLLPFRSRRRFDAKLRYEKPTSFFLEQTIEQLSIFVLTFRIMLTPHLINKVPHSKRSIHGKALKSLSCYHSILLPPHSSMSSSTAHLIQSGVCSALCTPLFVPVCVLHGSHVRTHLNEKKTHTRKHTLIHNHTNERLLIVNADRVK